MKAFGKTLGLILLGLLLILIILGFTLTHLIDPNEHKEQIRQLVRQRANLELRIAGDIHWKLFPWLGIRVRDASLASLRTPGQPFAYLQEADLSVRTLPLLRKRIQMSDVHLRGLDLHLSRDSNGLGNWEAAQAVLTGKSKAPAADTADNDAAPPSESPNRHFSIDSLTLEAGRISFSDARNNRDWKLDGIELRSGAIRPGHRIPLQISANFAQTEPTWRGQAQMQGHLRFDPALRRYQLDIGQLQGTASGKPVHDKTLDFGAQAQLLVDRGAQVADVNNLHLTLNQLSATTNLHLRDLGPDAKLEGKLSLAQFDLKAFLAGIGQPLIRTSAPDAFTRVQLNADIVGSANELRLGNLHLTLDDSAFTGMVEIAGLGQKPKTLVTLQGDRLNLDRYLANANWSKRPGNQAADDEENDDGLPPDNDQPVWSDDPILPVEQLKRLNGQWDLALAQLTLQDTQVQEGKILGSAAQGQIHLASLRGQLLGGSFQAAGDIDLTSGQPRLKGRLTTRALPIEPFLKSSKHGESLRGKLDLDADLDTSGNSQRAWIGALGGSAKFVINDGALLGSNLERPMCQGLAILNGQALNGPPQGEDTPFRELRGSLAIAKGVAHNPDLHLGMAGLRADGQGDLDLPAMTMDYRLGILIQGDQRPTADPACRVNERYANLRLPLHCQGPLQKGVRSCRLDRDELGKLAPGAASDRLESKIQEKLQEKVPEKYRDALKGLLNR